MPTSSVADSTTDNTADEPPTRPTVDGGPDERIAHRGPMRRWLISPEIGALIGAVVVWLFLWGNGETFGTAGTTLNWLDVAAPYGIMATAIALLMIGGEFDLSSGVMTGASAMIIGLTSRFFTGTGVHIGFAILAAFAAASAIGLFNGYMVNKTGLPSFIITLASFFVMRGLMLVLSKRLAEKVYVDQIKDQRGAAGLGSWIAHEWLLTEFGARDALFVTAVVVGLAAITYGLLEQSYIRRSRVSASDLVVAFVGAVGAILGFTGLLRTDGISSNYLFGALTAVGSIVAVVGVGRARWESNDRPFAGHDRSDAASPASSNGRAVVFRVYLGAVGIILACLIHFPFDRNERRAVLSWIAPGIRPIVVIAAGLAGLVFGVRSLRDSTRPNLRSTDAVKLLFLALYSALLVMTLTVSALQLSTVQALRSMGMMFLGTGGVALLLTARGIAAKHDRRQQLLIGFLGSFALVALGLVSRVDSSASRFSLVLPAGLCMLASALAANTILELLLKKRSVGHPAADRNGNRLQIIGSLLAVTGIATRLLFTNFTAAHAERLRAAGEPVPQNVLRETVVWWILVAAIGAFVLAKTKWGNWIFAVGGHKDASRAVGVPAERVKIGLFVAVALCGALSGTLIALRYGTVQADQGTGLEFEFIIAAVVGGCLMTGGYGSVIGASLGAAILAMSTTGFQTVQGWNGDGRYAFLGGVLLVAVLVNTYTRRKAQEAR